PPPCPCQPWVWVLLNWLLGNGDRRRAMPRRLQDGPSSGSETMLLELEHIAWCQSSVAGSCAFVSRTCSMLECVVHLRLQVRERELGRRGPWPANMPAPKRKQEPD
ncbi:hypothetical protein PVAP13_4NG183211, partial [Panicum virgatum]